MGEREIAMVAKWMIKEFTMGRMYLTSEGENKLYRMIENSSCEAHTLRYGGDKSF